MTCGPVMSNSTNRSDLPSEVQYSGMETDGMREAKCSLLLQEEADYDAKIKSLPRETVTVYQDRGLNNHQNPAAAPNQLSAPVTDEHTNTTSFVVDFAGATILQLEPVLGAPQKAMPVTVTVGGRCVFTPENYQDFLVMMRTKEQSGEMDILPNGEFDWPDVSSLLLCPRCGKKGPIPRAGDRKDHEYWMIFYPLLQITVIKGSQMTLGTRTICRLTCLHCMEDMLENLKLTIEPGGGSKPAVPTTPASPEQETIPTQPRRTTLRFTLPASDVLAEAGSASFLEDGPPRPDTHPHVDDILDAWTLYNLWEHSGAWEALQNDYRKVLARSMHADPSEAERQSGEEPRLKERMGKPCGNPTCDKVHGQRDPETDEVQKLVIKCRECNGAYYCTKQCREEAKDFHQTDCLQRQRDREERREKKAKKVQCDTCQKKFPYTKMKKCSRCRTAIYCSVDCQRLDWQRHRDVCC